MNVDRQHEYDITVVVTAHAEGRLAHRTMRSVLAAIDEARDLRIEIIIVIDNPTSETLKYFARWRDRTRVLDVSTADPGLNRNAAVAIAKGKYIAIIDADDLMGRRWLQGAFACAESTSLTNFIVHAEFTIYFGSRNLVTKHLSTRSADFPRADLMGADFWTSVLFAPRSTFADFPFLPSRVGSGFGYEDWHWISTILAAEGEMLLAPGTCKFTRFKKSGSLLAAHDSLQPLLRPSRFFDPRFFPCEKSQAALAKAPTADVVPEAGVSTWKERIPRVISGATEWCPPIQKTLGAAYRLWTGKKPGVDPASIPSIIRDQWLAVAEFEPELFPSESHLRQMAWYATPHERIVDAYVAMCRKIANCHVSHSPQFTHVFLVPWLKTGGADLVATNYVLEIAKNSNHRLLVIATESSDSPWKSRLPESVTFIDIADEVKSLRVPRRKQLLAQLLVHLQPDVIHLIHSRLGNQVFESHGRALSQISRLYDHVFCVDFSAEGAEEGFAIEFFPEFCQYLTAAISENHFIWNYLEEKFAIDPDKLLVNYQPVTIKPLSEPRRPQPEAPLRVLWAGRLDRQKHPEIMVEIAKRCPVDHFHFHVYGSSVLANENAQMNFGSTPNITFHGKFNGLSSLPTQEYDVFLHTSQWDGMPNILLEATAVGLPIISSDVGGIGELIKNDETGLVVSPFDNVDQYVLALKRLRSDAELRARFVSACRQLVAERHSWERFSANVLRLPGHSQIAGQLEVSELSQRDRSQ